MDDLIALADRAFDEICKTAQVEPNEVRRMAFRLGFASGRLHEMDKVIATLQPGNPD